MNKLRGYIITSFRQAGLTLDRANHIIINLNYFYSNAEATKFTYSQQIEFLKTHQGTDSEALRFKKLKDTYNNSHNDIKMFDNVVCSELNKKK